MLIAGCRATTGGIPVSRPPRPALLPVAHRCCVLVNGDAARIIEIDRNDPAWFDKATAWKREGFEIFMYETIQSYDNAAVNSIRLKGHIEKLEQYFIPEPGTP